MGEFHLIKKGFPDDHEHNGIIAIENSTLPPPPEEITAILFCHGSLDIFDTVTFG